MYLRIQLDHQTGPELFETQIRFTLEFANQIQNALQRETFEERFCLRAAECARLSGLDDVGLWGPLNVGMWVK